MLIATTVTKQEELEQIYRLNQENLRQNLSAQERQQEGFVSWLYSVQLLQQMHALAPSIIIKDADKVVAYALTTLKEAAPFHIDFQNMIANMETLTYNGKLLSGYKYYCMGQICVHKDYRGRGLVNTLYRHHKEVYSREYDLLVTEVSSANLRSQKAHEKAGFETIHTYRDQMDEWNVVVWNWK